MIPLATSATTILCAVALAKRCKWWWWQNSVAHFVLALVVSACNARDGFCQDRARVKGEVKVGGVALSSRALSSLLLRDSIALLCQPSTRDESSHLESLAC